jgi:uncharacterized protein YegL
MVLADAEAARGHISVTGSSMGEAQRASREEGADMPTTPTTAGDTAHTTEGASSAASQTKPTVHFYVLLDRSGSMESMKSDVIGGFNDFLRTQQATAGKARMTMVQFDTQDPHDVIVDSVRISRVDELTPERFQPRGGTPLLDATAKLIETVLGREAKRRALGKDAEEIVFITVTDGEENQSRHTSLAQVQRLVSAGQEAGWNFVYLGAGLDAYGDAQRLGYHADSVQAFAADGEGAELMWKSVTRATLQMRGDVLAGRSFDKAAYFRGVKEAEARRNAK